MGFLEALKAIPDGEIDDILLGYTDRSSGGEARQRLKALSPEEHRLVGRFSLQTPLPHWHLKFYIPDLIEGFLARAPADPNAPVWDIVASEYEASLLYVHLFTEIGKMPILILDDGAHGRSLTNTDPMDIPRYWEVLDPRQEVSYAKSLGRGADQMKPYETRLSQARQDFR